MQDNRSPLTAFFESGSIHLKQSSLFEVELPPKPSSFDFGYVEGMLLGLAIGDALGVPTESMLPAQRKERYGEVRAYLPNRYTSDGSGYPSDDTQLSFWTLEQLIKDKGFVPEHVAQRFTQEHIFGIGQNVRQFLANYKHGKPWHQAGPPSSGNGALMRIAPMLVPHLKEGGSGIWADTALSAMTTHNDSFSTSACLSFIAMLWELLDMTKAPEPKWWLESYVTTARELEQATTHQPRGGLFTDYIGPGWQFIQEKVTWAYEQDLSTEEACNAWFSGAYLLETVPSVLYILMRHGHDPEEAIVRAVNDTKDNDTIAAIVGAAVGALHGRSALPEAWVKNLSGRTTDRDDGKVFELIYQARGTFWGPAGVS